MLKYDREVKQIIAIATRFSLGDSQDKIEKDIDLVLLNFARQLGANVIGLETEFNGFWMECPRKVGKTAAKKSFEKAIRDVMRVNKVCQNDAVLFLKKKIIEYGKQFSADKTYCKHPSTWLNQGCYWDEHPSVDEANKGLQGYSFLD